jgi:hypothetical protein
MAKGIRFMNPMKFLVELQPGQESRVVCDWEIIRRNIELLVGGALRVWTEGAAPAVRVTIMSEEPAAYEPTAK